MFNWFPVALSLGILIQLLPLVGGMPSPFTKIPQSVLYVARGQNARMVWDYNVSNKNTEFGSYSPTWYIYRNTTRIQVAYEYKWGSPKWKWIIAQECPDSLKSRISKESSATLVISNVTTADSGVYECSLTLTSGLVKSSKVELIVTASSLGSITREEGEDVVFMFNTSTNIQEATWGIRDGDTSNFRMVLIYVDTSGVTPNAAYAGRVSWVGDLSKGQAWFKMANLNINDTNQYTARFILQGESSYRYTTTRLTVIQTVTTRPLQTTTTTTTTGRTYPPSSSQTSPRPTTSQVPHITNRSISVKVIKEELGDFNDPNSTAFKNFSQNFVFEINSVYRNIDSFEKAKVTSLSENIIPVNFVLYFKNTIKSDEICAPLEDAVKDNRLGSLKIVPSSLECSSDPSTSFPKNQSSSGSSCTSIIAACVTIILILILVVVVLLIYIWKLRLKTGKKAESRSSSIKDKELEVYENAQLEKTTEATTTQITRTPNTDKELYETINDKRAKGTATVAANVKPERGPSVGTQANVHSLPQYYQELNRKVPNPTTLYEPLNKRDFGNQEELTSEGPKTYEQLQQSESGREYQSLKRYKDTESKV